MKLVHQLKNCRDYLLIGSDVYSIQKGQTTIYRNGTQLVDVQELNKLSSLLYLSDDYIIVRDSYYYSCILNITAKEIKPFLGLKKVVLGVFEDKILFCDSGQKTQGVYYWKEDRVAPEFKEEADYWFGDYTVSRELEALEFSIYPHLMGLWKLEASHFPDFGYYIGDVQKVQIGDVLGIYNECLWVTLNDGRLLGLDIVDGAIKHNLEKCLVKPQNFICDASLDKKKGVIKIFEMDIYREIDLTTLKETKRVQISMDKEFRVRQATHYPGDKFIYFSAYYGETFPSIYGIFDTEECKITWWEEMVKDGKGNAIFKAPKANKKLFAILDNKDVLHVYDRD